MSTRFLSRRSLIQLVPALALPAFGVACKSLDEIGRGFGTKLNKKVHWVRRQEWRGIEMVRAIAQYGDRFILVKYKETNRWDFPGGLVNEKIHGPKTKENGDLVHAVTDYTHSQAMVPVMDGVARLEAYGYGIDVSTNQTYLVHWLHVIIPTNLIPTLNANLSDTAEAKWVALDDPFLRNCLEQRIKEYKLANEGNSVLLEPCRT